MYYPGNDKERKMKTWKTTFDRWRTFPRTTGIGNFPTANQNFTATANCSMSPPLFFYNTIQSNIYIYIYIYILIHTVTLSDHVKWITFNIFAASPCFRINNTFTCTLCLTRHFPTVKTRFKYHTGKRCNPILIFLQRNPFNIFRLGTSKS